MRKLTVILSALLLAVLPAVAQREFGGTVRFDKTVHDFGTVDVKDGALNCSFEVTNIGSEVLNIFAVTTTCSCTKVSWTKGDIAPGAKGTIEVSYSNDEGPYPFDKALHVYLSGFDRPVILHVKGVTIKARKK